ncbi:NAD(P)-dependent dehydrogenase (short-subunit alcohol dehydrogenase family) [Aquibacillus albus]|uniref:NAD(P)-dependent dehydrogenase (Short-subunit alcohol dehydrogenase family) n=1 Tax=Aquibacillus albus TaxID=1168171 RepID=A0ABS2MWX3_9BACI|nr:NAD(P)-dependent dehydrogenase (short-subunit alcohol dehydrogenase family) [Aquibacillus albus]
MGTLNEKVAVLTGGARGMGHAITNLSTKGQR